MSSMSTCGSVAASIRPAGSASRRSSSRTAPPSSPSRRTEGPQLLRRLEIAGNPYIGVFCAANDELLIVARDVPKSAIRHIGGALETSPIVTSVGHSTVVGSLLALNSKGILASPFIEEAEIEAIGDAVYPLPHRLNAVGNNVLCNDYGAVLQPFRDHREDGQKIGAPLVAVLCPVRYQGRGRKRQLERASNAVLREIPG